MIPEHLEKQVTNNALLNYCHELEQSVKYWKDRAETTSKSLHMIHDEAGEKHADQKAEIGLWASAAESLWDLMDDIDTLSDSIRPRDEESHAKFYRLTMELVKRRNDHVRHNETGGLSLVLPSA